MPNVDVLSPGDVLDITSVLAESFHDYPVMQYVLGPDGDYAARLRRLLTFFDMARVLRDEVMLGVRVRGRLEATVAFAVEQPHIHLSMIGVRRASQGLGLGRALLEAVHELSAADPTSTGVTPTTLTRRAAAESPPRSCA